MKQKKLFLMAAMVLTATMTFAQSKVYFTKEITPESLVKSTKHSVWNPRDVLP